MEEYKSFKNLDKKIIKRLIGFLKPYNKFVIFAIVLTLITSALVPLRPFLTKLAIDDYIAESDWNGLIIISIVIFAALIVSGGLRFGLTYLMESVGQKVLLDIRKSLFKHINSLSFSFYDKTSVGKLVTRVTNDIESLNQLFSSGIVMIIADILLIFWIIGFMFYTDADLALLTLSIVPFLIIVSYVFRLKVRKLFLGIRTQVAKMNSYLNEFISGIMTVKLFNQEKRQEDKFRKINKRTFDLHNETIFYYAIFFPVIELLATAALGIILWYTAGNIISGVMTIGTLIAFLQYSEMFFSPVRDLTEKYTTLQSGLAAAERIFELFDQDEKISDVQHPVKFTRLKDKIEFRKVYFSYDTKKTVLKDVSFGINKGETVAIVGATGSGKSTIVNLLTRLYEVTEGEILIDGIDLSRYEQQSFRSSLALVMQDVFLFSRSIRENITLGNDKISDEEIINSAEKLGALKFISQLPNFLDEPVMERGATLSGGQRQLISFCRAYVTNPDLLILDEATSSIDTETEQIIENALDILLKDRTSIIIAHRLSTIKRADKIITIHHGEIKEIGKHEELLAQDGIYSKLYKLQYEMDKAV